MNRFLVGALVGLEFLDFGTIHVLYHLICLPFLEAEAETLVRVVFVVLLVFVVFYLDEVGVDGVGVEREGDEGVEGCFFGD